MAAFKPFANDSQVVTITSGDDELSLENGTDAIVLSGTLTLTRGNAAARANLEQLRVELDKVLAALN